LASLAEQAIDRSRFEVVVGALENSPEYTATCQEFAPHLNLISVMTDAEWNCSQARNMALHYARGDVIVFLDADMALPPGCLKSLEDRYYSGKADKCVLGQMVGYDNLTDEAAGTADSVPYSHYREVLANLEATPGMRVDQRWCFDPIVLPWTMVWTSFVAIPSAVIREHGLLFDENFRGWGGEDQEWGYRVGATGIPIVRAEGVCGLHLPHVRDVKANLTTFEANKHYFLAKWPSLDVELYRAFGSWEANRRYADITREVAEATAGDGTLGVAVGIVEGAQTMVLGTVLDGAGRFRDAGVQKIFDDGPATKVLPLIGLSLPFQDDSIKECRVLPPVLRLSGRYREAVLREAERVSCNVVLSAA
jgi:hypothetical protein